MNKSLRDNGLTPSAVSHVVCLVGRSSVRAKDGDIAGSDGFALKRVASMKRVCFEARS